MPKPLYRFGAFFFRTDTGELLRQVNSKFEVQEQLAPQPTKLLCLLIENYPDLVSRQQIKDHIWPDVHVEYDRSLHFCVRQIRAALSENASNPKFIETIPRKGYRWISPPEQLSSLKAIGLEPELKSTIVPETDLPNKRKLFRSGRIALLLLVFAGLCIAGLKFLPTDVTTATPRVGIMPMQPTDRTHFFFNNEIAYLLLDDLGKYSNTLDILGPTSTEKYVPADLKPLSQELKVDWIINGKFLTRGDTSKILAEIIRTSDGAHRWVKYFDRGSSSQQIAEEISTGLLAEIGVE